MAGVASVCDCGREFVTNTAWADLCPACLAVEDEIYKNDPTPYVDTEPRPWSKAAMRERLGVIGDVDE